SNISLYLAKIKFNSDPILFASQCILGLEKAMNARSIDEMCGELIMSKKICLLLFFVCFGGLFAYNDGSVLVLLTGAKTLTVNNSGSQGGTKIVAFPNNGNQKIKIWQSTAGFPEHGAESACADPCSISMNLEYGAVKYWYEMANSNGNPLSLRWLSSKLYLPFVRQPCETAPFAVPVMIHGFENYEHCMSFNVPSGTPTSGLRLWMWVTNWRNGAFSVIANGTEHKLATIPITGLISGGTNCTATTPVPYGLTTGPEQLNGFADQATFSPTTVVNGTIGVASIPSPTTFKWPCALPVPG